MNIIQIGCNDGKDHVFDFVSSHVDDIQSIILIDANIKALHKCRETYAGNIMHKCMFMHAAVITDETIKEIEIWSPADEEVSQHTSILQTHLSDHKHINIVSNKVPAVTLNKLLSNYHYNDVIIDRLYIDVEGIDADIVRSIDFNAFKIKYIFFEHAHTDGAFSWGGPKYDDCKKYLEENGFKIHQDGPNTIASIE